MPDLISILLLIAASALFAVSEIAVAAARKIRLQMLADEGNQQANEVLTLQQNPGAFFAMIQIALNAIAILGGILGEQSLTPMFYSLISLVYQGAMVEQLSFVASFVSITALFILFADLLPKRIAMIMPEPIALKIIKPMRWVTIALTPLVLFFNGITNTVLRMFNLPIEQRDVVTADDIVATIGAGLESGSLQQQEYQLIENVFELESRTLSSAMTPRDRLIYFEKEEDGASISSKITEHPHNSFLVCDGGLDNIVGILDAKEILKQVLSGKPVGIDDEAIDTELFYLPEMINLSQALQAFKQANKPMALVANEYGLVVGIVTIKDLLGGFINDLILPQGEEMIVVRDEQSWLIDGLTPINEVAKCLAIDSFPEQSQYETISGFLIHRLKKLPKPTDAVVFSGYSFEVIELEGVRIERVLVTVKK